MRKFLAVTGACVLLAGCGGSSRHDDRGDVEISRIAIDGGSAVGRDMQNGVAMTFAEEEPAGGSAQHVPSNAVASVDGDPILKADYDHWFEIIARSESPTGGKPVIPDPPSYVRCISALKERAGRVRGRKAPSETQLRAQCRTRETRVRRMTMALLIQAVWFEKECEALGIEVPDAKVKEALRKSKRQNFGSEGEYKRFLRDSGITEGDVLFRLRIDELTTAIVRHVQRGAGKDKAKRLKAFGREFQKRWTEQTECRAGFVIKSFCGDAAGRKATSTAGGDVVPTGQRGVTVDERRSA